MQHHDLTSRLQHALAARKPLFQGRFSNAIRLFNGFVEGWPTLAIDQYDRTLVVHDHTDDPSGDPASVQLAVATLREALPEVTSVVWKIRRSPDPAARNGVLLLGDASMVATEVHEHGVRYALALQLQRDASLYLDTRGLRQWLLQSVKGLHVLNAFAYTGSLGVAARMGGAASVTQLDRSEEFLAVGRRSYALNGLVARRGEFQVADYFRDVARRKREGQLFDCVLLDPPFFSNTDGGRVDLVGDARRVIDKVRPLIADNGLLVSVNNALFVSGAEYQSMLDAMCASGYLSFETRIEIPLDFAATAETRVGAWPTDPSPYNHPTKIAVLRVRRKDGRAANITTR